MILLESINQSRDAEGVTEKILREIALPFLLKGESVRLTLSVSISLYPDHGEDGESLLRAADHAMYQAKRKSKNGYLVFSRHTDQTGQKE